ncbi:MAG TPA: hypothetical protein VMF87_24735 [Streptosporangiaceae bacterium]|jgi:hypothetical protein|nr:hypothetical protein [Streptosporangiaceae bacterium]
MATQVSAASTRAVSPAQVYRDVIQVRGLVYADDMAGSFSARGVRALGYRPAHELESGLTIAGPEFSEAAK